MVYSSSTGKQPEEMDKKTAEEILGFDSSCTYSQADMTERYHKMVTDKVNSGAGAEEMGRVDHAKAYLDSYFVEDPTASLTSESNLYSSAYAPSYDSGYSMFDFSMDAIGVGASSMIGDSNMFAPVNLASVYNSAHQEAARSLGFRDNLEYDVPELDGDYPLWYQVVSKLILRFPWRGAFLLVVAMIGFPAIWSGDVDGNMFEMAGAGLGMVFESIVLLAVIGANTIFGVFTNLIRRGISIVADKLLRMQIFSTAKRSLKRQFGDGKIEPSDSTVIEKTSSASR